ncbi:transposase [candidate division KSB1 bacterium]
MKRTAGTESVGRAIRRKNRKKYSAEKKIHIVLEGLGVEESISALYRRDGISPNLYYRWSKDFLEAGKKRLQGDTVREANTSNLKTEPIKPRGRRHLISGPLQNAVNGCI